MAVKDLRELFNSFLEMNWLRPENAAWDTVASMLLSEHLKPGQTIMDVGCGNGLTTFISSGGRMSLTYDWYVNTNPNGFDQNADIYDFDNKIDISEHIAKKPAIVWEKGVDHKAALIAQAAKLSLYRESQIADLDTKSGVTALDGSYDLIFSNILYWLRNPQLVLEQCAKSLKPDGTLLVAFPNENFFAYCESYQYEEKKSEFLRLLNRGRRETHHWTMSLGKFQKLLKTHKIGLEVVEHTPYLSERTLNYWDFGLRPLSVPMLNLTARMAPDERLRFKKDWIQNISDLYYEMFLLELQSLEERRGAYSFVQLAKTK